MNIILETVCGCRREYDEDALVKADLGESLTLPVVMGDAGFWERKFECVKYEKRIPIFREVVPMYITDAIAQKRRKNNEAVDRLVSGGKL